MKHCPLFWRMRNNQKYTCRSDQGGLSLTFSVTWLEDIFQCHQGFRCQNDTALCVDRAAEEQPKTRLVHDARRAHCVLWKSGCFHMDRHWSALQPELNILHLPSLTLGCSSHAVLFLEAEQIINHCATKMFSFNHKNAFTNNSHPRLESALIL